MTKDSVMNNKRVISAFEGYYRRNGVKMSKILNNEKEVSVWRLRLKKNRRKFLGVRPVKLIEVE